MINFNVYIAHGYKINPTHISLPVIGEIISDENLEIATKIDLAELTLEPCVKAGEDDFYGRLTRCHLGAMPLSNSKDFPLFATLKS